MKLRHEWKIEVNRLDFLILRQRLRVVMRPDGYAVQGKYRIRSLYFDTPTDQALLEKKDGVNHREKFRIRYYNGDTTLIRLEKKSKWNSLCGKVSVPMTAQQGKAIVDGSIDWMMDSGEPLLQELYHKMQWQGLRPKTIVDYTREPFVFAPGNVRVTLDYDIRTGLSCTDFLNPGCITIPAADAPAILEVKWDDFLPDIIRDAVQLPGRRAAAFSKYEQCRIYG